MSGSAIGDVSIGSMVVVPVKVLDDMRDDAVVVMLSVVLTEALDPFVAES